MSQIDNKLKCVICNKVYASQSSLCHHNKKFHKNQSNNNNNEIIQENNKIIKCEYCNKIFSSRFSKCEHKKKACKFNPNNPSNTNKFDLLEKKIDLLEKENKEIKKLIQRKTEKQYSIQPKNKSKNKINIVSSNNNNVIDFSQNIFLFNNNPIKFLYHDSKIFFKGNDITKILNNEIIIDNIDVRDKFKINYFPIETISNSFLQSEDSETIFISESGFYKFNFPRNKHKKFNSLDFHENPACY